MKLTHRYIGRTTGRHRKEPAQSAPAAVVAQRFVTCGPCGVETAATVHGDMLRCAEGHDTPAGGAA
ncbi:hypothetical protein OHB14_36465 [Streptomyces sp. NBC_01613]|uniref:hypothetical protein n=1 Tax=Streptomyces sp. NBC_01613 TaxID=2975896 RepID=UPI003866AF12